jgi:hypothetical protein
MIRHSFIDSEQCGCITTAACVCSQVLLWLYAVQYRSRSTSTAAMQVDVSSCIIVSIEAVLFIYNATLHAVTRSSAVCMPSSAKKLTVYRAFDDAHSSSTAVYGCSLTGDTLLLQHLCLSTSMRICTL